MGADLRGPESYEMSRALKDCGIMEINERKRKIWRTPCKYIMGSDRKNSLQCASYESVGRTGQCYKKQYTWKERKNLTIKEERPLNKTKRGIVNIPPTCELRDSGKYSTVLKRTWMRLRHRNTCERKWKEINKKDKRSVSTSRSVIAEIPRTSE